MTAPSLPEALPPIPNKRYFTIGEVGVLCDVKAHVLRYWEQEFGQLKPTKRQGNRRYYQRHDIELIRQIRSLLYDQGFTIAGARLQLTQARGAASTGAGEPAAVPVSAVPFSSVPLSLPIEPTLNWDLLSQADHPTTEPQFDDVPAVPDAEPMAPVAPVAGRSLSDILMALDGWAETIASALAAAEHSAER